MVNSAHWTKTFLTTHLGTGSIFVFTEKILWIISLILKISSLLPPGSCGGPDTDLKLDIMKLNSHIIQLNVYLCIFWYIENIRYEINILFFDHIFSKIFREKWWCPCAFSRPLRERDTCVLMEICPYSSLLVEKPLNQSEIAAHWRAFWIQDKGRYGLV